MQATWPFHGKWKVYAQRFAIVLVCVWQRGEFYMHLHVRRRLHSVMSWKDKYSQMPCLEPLTATLKFHLQNSRLQVVPTSRIIFPQVLFIPLFPSLSICFFLWFMHVLETHHLACLGISQWLGQDIKMLCKLWCQALLTLIRFGTKVKDNISYMWWIQNDETVPLKHSQASYWQLRYFSF